ncbi:MAG: serine hydrolase [Eubacteriales bacterium]|nr:serine hydrolase [Eubacteriales bacterium]
MAEERELTLREYFEQQAASFPGKVAYLYAELNGDIGKEELPDAAVHGEISEMPAPACRPAGNEVRILLSSHARDAVVSASTIKIPIMLCLFDRMKREGLGFDTALPVRREQICEDSLVFEYGPREATLYELTVWMIVNSDNTATNVLMEYLGFVRMNEFFVSLGLKETRAQRIMLDFEAVAQGRNNYTSPEDIFRCMDLIYRQRESDPMMETAWEILTRNRDHESLQRYLYEPLVCAHKTGGLDDIEHDAGIFLSPEGDYFLGVFVSEFSGGEAQAKEAAKLIGRLSRRVLDERRGAGYGACL